MKSSSAMNKYTRKKVSKGRFILCQWCNYNKKTERHQQRLMDIRFSLSTFYTSENFMEKGMLANDHIFLYRKYKKLTLK